MDKKIGLLHFENAIIHWYHVYASPMKWSHFYLCFIRTNGTFTSVPKTMKTCRSNHLYADCFPALKHYRVNTWWTDFWGSSLWIRVEPPLLWLWCPLRLRRNRAALNDSHKALDMTRGISLRGAPFIHRPQRSPGNPCPRLYGCCSGKDLPRDGGGRSPRPREGFLFLLFNILKLDERINKARLPDPYVPFRAACP